MKLLIPPPIEFFTTRDTGYFADFIKEVQKRNPGYAGPKKVEQVQAKTYSGYNYSPGGLTSGIKTGHFEQVLQYAQPWFGKASVLDMGCADGYFLPSLSFYFPEVVCADIEKQHCICAEGLKEMTGVRNVSVVCTEGSGLNSLSQKYHNHFDLIFLLEVMEHVGDPKDLWPSKLAFLKQVGTMLKPEGKIIITVPVMTGWRFLLQRTGLAMLGMYREPLSWGEILNAGLFRKTESLEKRWWGQSHLGFNHHKLVQTLSSSFKVVEQKRMLFQQMIILQC